MNFHLRYTLMSSAVVVGALAWWLMRAPARNGPSAQPTSTVPNPHTLSTSGDQDERISELRAEVRALQMRDTLPVAAAPAASTAPAAREATPAPTPLSAEEATELNLDLLNNKILSQSRNPAAAREMRDALRSQVAIAGLKDLLVDDVDCYETLCKLNVGFGSTKNREHDLDVVLQKIDDAYFVYVPTAESTSAEIYVARSGAALFDPPVQGG